MIFCRTCLNVGEDYDCPPLGYVDTFVLEKPSACDARLKAIKDCRDMFMVQSVSWKLLNEKLEAEASMTEGE